MSNDILNDIDILLNGVGNLFSMSVSVATSIFNSLQTIFWFLFLVSLIFAVFNLFDIRRLIKNNNDMTKRKK